MWGISFDDMAKKAAELQTQAAHAAESFAQSPSAVSFGSPRALFNLDGIQKDEEKALKPTSAQTKPLENLTTAVSEDKLPAEKTSVEHVETSSLPGNNMERDSLPTSKSDNDDTEEANGWVDDLNDNDLDHVDDHDATISPESDDVLGVSKQVVVPGETVVVDNHQPEEATEAATHEPIELVSESTAAETTSLANDIATLDTEQAIELRVDTETKQQDEPQEVQQPLEDTVSSQPDGMHPPAESATSERVQAPTSDGIPDGVLEGFSMQLQRLEANFTAERTELLQQHQLEVTQLKASFTHNDCETERRRLEEEHSSQIQKLGERLHEVNRRNEGYRLKLDMLQREVDGTKKLLEERDGNMGKTHEEHISSLKELRGKLLAAQQKAMQYETDINSLKDSLDKANKLTESLQTQQTDLKTRMKTLAVELKDRRQECRQLTTDLAISNESSQRLMTEVDSLRLQISNQGLNSNEKEEELEQLKAALVDARVEVKKAETALREQVSQAEKVLADYKKKAQNSLALSNSRAAAAVQAKEEAELEARSARNTADMAMDKSVQAELNAKKEVAEARHYLKEMAGEKAQAERELEDARAALADCEKKLATVEHSLRESESEKERTMDALQKASSSLRDEKARAANLELVLDDLKRKENGLRNDLSTAREELQQQRKSLAAARAAATLPSENEKEHSTALISDMSASIASDSAANADDETLELFRRELREAKESNEELKETLAIVIAENEKLSNAKTPHSSADGEVGPSVPSRPQSESSDANSTPLFYAIEKQAELRTARDEITRLANLLSTVQSEKSEAEEAMTTIKLKMDELENRTKRFEKFGRQSENGGASVSNGAHKTSDSSLVNIEYLKNIVLRFLSASTVKERKTLLPAIGAVLELSREELKVAMQNVEQGASLSGMGSSLFETLSTTLGGA